jgi:hypothetical protein
MAGARCCWLRVSCCSASCFAYTRAVWPLCVGFFYVEIYVVAIFIFIFIYFSHFFVFACLRRELHPHEALKGGWGCSLFLWGVCMDLADLT